MLLALAQTSAGDSVARNIFDSVLSLFSRFDMLAASDELVATLQTMSVVWAVVFLAAGLLVLFSGPKHYKAVTICLAFVIGLFLGYAIGDRIGAPWVLAGSLALLLAVASYPLMKYAVAASGALSGAFIGANIWTGLAHALAKLNLADMTPESYWIGAMVGLIVCGMLAFILFEFSVAMYTSVSGATIAVLGVLCLLLSFEPWRPALREGLTGSQLVVPLLVFVPAVIGLILQGCWPAAAPAAPAKK